MKKFFIAIFIFLISCFAFSSPFVCSAAEVETKGGYLGHHNTFISDSVPADFSGNWDLYYTFYFRFRGGSANDTSFMIYRLGGNAINSSARTLSIDSITNYYYYSLSFDNLTFFVVTNCSYSTDFSVIFSRSFIAKLDYTYVSNRFSFSPFDSGYLSVLEYNISDSEFIFIAYDYISASDNYVISDVVPSTLNQLHYALDDSISAHSSAFSLFNSLFVDSSGSLTLFGYFLVLIFAIILFALIICFIIKLIRRD